MCIVKVNKDPDYEPPQPVTVRRRPSRHSPSQRTTTTTTASNVIIARPISVISHHSRPQSGSIRRISIIDPRTSGTGATITGPNPRPSQYVAAPATSTNNRSSLPRIIHVPDPPLPLQQRERLSGTLIVASASPTSHDGNSPRGSRTSMHSRHSRHSRSHSGSHHSRSPRGSAERVVYVATGRTSRGRDVNIVSEGEAGRDRERRLSVRQRRDGSWERTSRGGGGGGGGGGGSGSASGGKVYLSAPPTSGSRDRGPSPEAAAIAAVGESSKLRASAGGGGGGGAGAGAGDTTQTTTLYLEEPVRRSRSITYETNPRWSSGRVSERARVLVEDEDGRRREYYRSPATTTG